MSTTKFAPSAEKGAHFWSVTAGLPVRSGGEWPGPGYEAISRCASVEGGDRVRVPHLTMKTGLAEAELKDLALTAVPIFTDDRSIGRDIMHRHNHDQKGLDQR